MVRIGVIGFGQKGKLYVAMAIAQYPDSRQGAFGEHFTLTTCACLKTLQAISCGEKTPLPLRRHFRVQLMLFSSPGGLAGKWSFPATKKAITVS